MEDSHGSCGKEDEAVQRILAASHSAVQSPNSRSVQNEKSYFIPHQRTSPTLSELGNTERAREQSVHRGRLSTHGSVSPVAASHKDTEVANCAGNSEVPEIADEVHSVTFPQRSSVYRMPVLPGPHAVLGRHDSEQDELCDLKRDARQPGFAAASALL
jgi:hypothetical protein